MTTRRRPNLPLPGDTGDNRRRSMNGRHATSNSLSITSSACGRRLGHRHADAKDPSPQDGVDHPARRRSSTPRRRLERGCQRTRRGFDVACQADPTHGDRGDVVKRHDHVAPREHLRARLWVHRLSRRRSYRRDIRVHHPLRRHRPHVREELLARRRVLRFAREPFGEGNRARGHLGVHRHGATERTEQRCAGRRHGTSITVSWCGSTDDFGVVGYEVLRDGALVGSTASRLYAVTALQCSNDVHDRRPRARRRGQSLDASSILIRPLVLLRHDRPVRAGSASLSRPSTRRRSASAGTASSDDRGVLGYGVYRGTTRVGSDGATSFTVAGLGCSARYTIAVDAYDAAGNRSGRSSVTADRRANVHQAAAAISETPRPPASQRPRRQRRDRLDDLAPLDCLDGRLGVTGYGLYRDTVAAGSVSVPSATFAGLICGRSYQFSIDAYDPSGNRSARSTIVSSTAPCPDTAPPSTPSGLTQTSSTESTIGLSVVSIDRQRRGRRLWHLPGGVRVATTRSPGYSFASLTLRHDLHRRASTRSTPPAAALAQVTLIVSTGTCPADVQPPTVPQNQRSAGSPQNSFTMSWSAATDNVGVAGYAIYLDGVEGHDDHRHEPYLLRSGLRNDATPSA